MKLYRLTASQALPIGREQAWQFLSDPANLQRITPAHMGFRILSGADRAMYPGQIIQYNVSPLPGITTSWVTEITHVVDGQYFVDEQRFGPYRLWHHKHFITPIEAGILMEDIVDYALPLGILGRGVHALFVKKQLRTIFEYRSQRLKQLFGSLDAQPDSLLFKSI